MFCRYAGARNAQMKFRGLLTQAGGRRAALERMSGLRVVERYLERAVEAVEEHAVMDDYDETMKKINLELLALAMDADDTKTATVYVSIGMCGLSLVLMVTLFLLRREMDALPPGGVKLAAKTPDGAMVAADDRI